MSRIGASKICKKSDTIILHIVFRSILFTNMSKVAFEYDMGSISVFKIANTVVIITAIGKYRTNANKLFTVFNNCGQQLSTRNSTGTIIGKNMLKGVVAHIIQPNCSSHYWVGNILMRTSWYKPFDNGSYIAKVLLKIAITRFSINTRFISKNMY